MKITGILLNIFLFIIACLWMVGLFISILWIGNKLSVLSTIVLIAFAIVPGILIGLDDPYDRS